MKRNVEVGDFVFKHTGHEFQGQVRAVFLTSEGKPRVVVESFAQGSRGLLFIFRPDQLSDQLTGEKYDG